MHWLTQLLSYGFYWWVTFALLAFAAAKFGAHRGIVLGHIVIAAIVIILDLRWIQAEMHRPGWNGIPDQDMVFALGLLFRVILINTLLLPVSLLGLRLNRRNTRSPAAPFQ